MPSQTPRALSLTLLCKLQYSLGAFDITLHESWRSSVGTLMLHYSTNYRAVSAASYWLLAVAAAASYWLYTHRLALSLQK